MRLPLALSLSLLLSSLLVRAVAGITSRDSGRGRVRRPTFRSFRNLSSVALLSFFHEKQKKRKGSPVFPFLPKSFPVSGFREIECISSAVRATSTLIERYRIYIYIQNYIITENIKFVQVGHTTKLQTDTLNNNEKIEKCEFESNQGESMSWNGCSSMDKEKIINLNIKLREESYACSIDFFNVNKTHAGTWKITAYIVRQQWNDPYSRMENRNDNVISRKEYLFHLHVTQVKILRRIATQWSRAPILRKRKLGDRKTDRIPPRGTSPSAARRALRSAGYYFGKKKKKKRKDSEFPREHFLADGR